MADATEEGTAYATESDDGFAGHVALYVEEVQFPSEKCGLHEDCDISIRAEHAALGVMSSPEVEVEGGLYDVVAPMRTGRYEGDAFVPGDAVATATMDELVGSWTFTVTDHDVEFDDVLYVCEHQVEPGDVWRQGRIMARCGPDNTGGTLPEWSATYALWLRVVGVEPVSIFVADDCQSPHRLLTGVEESIAEETAAGEVTTSVLGKLFLDRGDQTSELLIRHPEQEIRVTRDCIIDF